MRRSATNASPTPTVGPPLAPHGNVTPIPGTTSVERLEENLAAAEISLSAAELTAVEEVAPRGFAAGTRYPEASMKTLNR